jgi:hypothetical protein
VIYDARDPATWPIFGAAGFVVGLDVGQMQDHSALVVGGVWPEANHAAAIVEIKQFPLGMPLPEVAGAAAEIALRYRSRIVCDTSNNSAFPSILAPLVGGRPADRLIAGVITNALAHASSPTAMVLAIAGQRVGIPRWTLSKRELIEAIGAEMGGGTLRFGKNGDWETLRDELNAMEREVRQSGSVSYSAPAGKHDDLVSALGLCLFGLRRFQPQVRRAAGPRRAVPSAAAWT